MTSLIPILSALLLMLGAVTSPRRAHRRQSQRAATTWSGLAVLINITALAPASLLGKVSGLLGDIGSTFALSGPRHLMLVAFANALLGFVAIVLSPRSTHDARTYSRILLLIAVGEAFLAVKEPLTLSVLWALSLLIVDHQLQSSQNSADAGRLFRIYQIPSALLFLGGAVLLSLGRAQLAAIPLLAAIALREAVLPGHGWFIRFVERAPIGIIVAFVAPQLGVYAHLELLHRSVSPGVAHFVAGAGAISALFGALMALGQTNVRRAVAYLVMSQTGLVAFGLESTSGVGWAGAVITWLVSALGSTALLLCIAAVSARRGTLIMGHSAGHPEQVPRLAVATLLSGLATVGAPLSLGFIAEDLLVQGSVSEHPYLGLGLVVVTAVNGITVLRIYFGLFTAGHYRPGERDVTQGELAALSIILGLLLLGGVFPGGLVAFIH